MWDQALPFIPKRETCHCAWKPKMFNKKYELLLQCCIRLLIQTFNILILLYSRVDLFHLTLG